MLKTDGGVPKWAAGGTAWRFEHVGAAKRAQTLVDLFGEALDLSSDEARAHWTAQLTLLDLKPLTDELASGAIPEMSEASSRFVYELLNHNLGRLNDAI